MTYQLAMHSLSLIHPSDTDGVKRTQCNHCVGGHFILSVGVDVNRRVPACEASSFSVFNHIKLYQLSFEFGNPASSSTTKRTALFLLFFCYLKVSLVMVRDIHNGLEGTGCIHHCNHHRRRPQSVDASTTTTTTCPSGLSDRNRRHRFWRRPQRQRRCC